MEEIFRAHFLTLLPSMSLDDPTLYRSEHKPLALQCPELVPLIEREDASGSALLSIFVFLMELYSLNLRSKAVPSQPEPFLFPGRAERIVKDAFQRIYQKRQERDKLKKLDVLSGELHSYDSKKILKGSDIMSALVDEDVASSVACSQEEDVSEFVHMILASFTEEEQLLSMDGLLNLSQRSSFRLSEQVLRSLHADAVRRRVQLFHDRNALKRRDALVEILKKEHACAPSVNFVLDILRASDRNTSDRSDVDPAFRNAELHQVPSSSGMSVPLSYLIGVLVDWGWAATRGTLPPINRGELAQDLNSWLGSFGVHSLSNLADVFLGMIASPEKIFNQHSLVSCARFLHKCNIINNLVPSGSQAGESGAGAGIHHIFRIGDYMLDPSWSDCGVSDCPLSLSSSRALVQRILPGNLPGQFDSGDLADDRSTTCPASDAGGGGLPPAIDITHRGTGDGVGYAANGGFEEPSPRQVIGLFPLFAAPDPHRGTPVNNAPEILPAVGDQQSPPGLSTTPGSSCPQAGSPGPGDGVPCGGGNVPKSGNSGPNSTQPGSAATPALGRHPKRVHLAIDDKSDPHADLIANGILYVLMILFLSLVLILGCKSAFAEGGVLEAVALSDLEDRNVSWHLPT